MQTHQTPYCILCESSDLTAVKPSEPLRSVTSDCKPWDRNYPVSVCAACGHVQKQTGPPWSDDAEEIYAGYEVYHLSEGEEQRIFHDTGSATRSMHVLRELDRCFSLCGTGRLLDVGCGNGSLLRSFSELRPGWQMDGLERDDRSHQAIRAIPGVEHCYAGELSQLQDRYDLITLFHVLEHIPQPQSFLQALRDRLSPGGLLLVQVPNQEENPFDLMVADHCSHFAPAALATLARRSGFIVRHIAVDWAPKEISLVLGLEGESFSDSSDGLPPDKRLSLVTGQITFLETLCRQSRETAEKKPFGIFGASIAATWLAGNLRERVRFFVDEDSSRIGRQHLGKNVYAPAETPAGSAVCLAFPPAVAKRVCERLKPLYPALEFTIPPSLPDCS